MIAVSRRAALAGAAAALLMTAAAPSTVSADTATIKCFGINSCKGHGIGNNACAGKGIVRTSQANCTAKGGRVVS